MNKDNILIEDLKIEALVGVHPWEQLVKQPLSISLEATTDFYLASKKNSLENTLNYQSICERIEQLVSEEPILLLEAIAEKIANNLSQSFKITALKLTIKKPCAIKKAKSVGVQIERSYE